MNLGPHAFFISASYIFVVIVIACLIAWIMTDYVTQNRILKDLEQRGITRRSKRGDAQ